MHVSKKGRHAECCWRTAYTRRTSKWFDSAAKRMASSADIGSRYVVDKGRGAIGQSSAANTTREECSDIQAQFMDNSKYP